MEALQPGCRSLHAHPRAWQVRSGTLGCSKLCAAWGGRLLAPRGRSVEPSGSVFLGCAQYPPRGSASSPCPLLLSPLQWWRRGGGRQRDHVCVRPGGAVHSHQAHCDQGMCLPHQGPCCFALCPGAACRPRAAALPLAAPRPGPAPAAQAQARQGTVCVTQPRCTALHGAARNPSDRALLPLAAMQAYGAVDTDGSRFLLSDYLGNLYLLLLLREDGAGGRGCWMCCGSKLADVASLQMPLLGLPPGIPPADAASWRSSFHSCPTLLRHG